MTNKEHPLAHILRAIAEGVTVQGRWASQEDWWDLDSDAHSILLNSNSTIKYRIKPKPKVKKYRFVYKDTRGNLGVSSCYFVDENDFNKRYNTLTAVQRIESTMIEVEE